VGGEEGGGELGFWFTFRRSGDGGGNKSELTGSTNTVSVKARSTMGLLVGLSLAVVLLFSAGVAGRKYQSRQANKLIKNIGTYHYTAC
jgi:hypothetical protein